ncbi:MAG: hypothetical protein JXQ65_01280 [Candidatus Marinimicrobia bacterium]|nr:hypothetical protein [Candidatus Neomarinimicrobiota bacterium]
MKKQKNYREFILIGLCFLGSGIVFLSTVSRGVGFGLIAVGITYLGIGIKKTGLLKPKH